nr:MAG TPA: hypothetical protein [Caudoviricetes sp.]DAX45756.1 MAG TPA: hypothetical protein [Caudoviricetes sp.]
MFNRLHTHSTTSLSVCQVNCTIFVQEITQKPLTRSRL